VVSSVDCESPVGTYFRGIESTGFILQGAHKLAFSLCALLMLVTATTTGSHAQLAADRLWHVKKLYVDSLGTDRGAAEMRAQMIHRLRRTREIQLVSDTGKADAVVKGTGRTWLTGYISLSPRSHSLSQPMFDGFLSVEIVDKNNQTFWLALANLPGTGLQSIWPARW
jgi:hypothetical protein